MELNKILKGIEPTGFKNSDSVSEEVLRHIESEGYKLTLSGKDILVNGEKVLWPEWNIFLGEAATLLGVDIWKARYFKYRNKLRLELIKLIKR